MAQSVFQNLVDSAGLTDQFLIDSAGTSNEEEGNPPHPGTQRKLAEKRIPLVPHASRPINPSEFEDWDLIIYMDVQNKTRLEQIFSGQPGEEDSSKLQPLLAFAIPGGPMIFNRPMKMWSLGARAFLNLF